MAFEAKVNTCGLFKNDRYPDKSDFSTQIQIESPKCHTTSAWWVNGWNKVSKNGLAFISLVLKPKQENATAYQTFRRDEQ
jgi:hypothetical protein